ncbi:MAG: branched-chain amino acid ABC transporter permease [Deltaproteobacteria bacterium]|nr:branched-chain amino acid ABC transporter permease [Deltaproteobacteria bacterium]MBW1950740.1 branched-chain amino acid ABC transporter permease [Deltaproteobacteria bacterium]MBW2008375.1 branched-chain amino acid ABC transporter permease [Deltaproteobacteria bacterium]MBW2348431.1 branched-chain amino acid ABC transporter permease [Deltaproteobacteria bacterium]
MMGENSRTDIKIYLGLLVLLIVLLLLPTRLSITWTRTFAMVFLFIYWASAWNIIGGMAGEINFLHPIFIGAGAYSSTVLYINFGVSPWVGMFLGAAIAVVLGLVIGWICYRSGLPHLSFALICLGFSHIGEIIALEWDLLGGSRGLVIRPAPGLANMQFETISTYYYMGLGMAVLMVGICHWISRNKLGYYLKAIKHNETASAAIGIDTVRYRLLALAVSAFFCALGGTFYAQLVLYIDPHSAVSITAVISMILFCAIGGFGTVLGPVVGTLILMPIGEVVRLYVMTGFHLIIYGVLVIVVILLSPHGLVPWFQSRMKKTQEESPA